jgi:hypothetical protein
LDHQEQILFETHGIATSTNAKEEDGSLAELLQQLDKELGKISRKDAYEQALFMNPAYVRDERFRLQFLRAVEYHPTAAANRMVNHFEVKRELFGDGEALAREIRQSDLSPEDMEQLRRGVEQMFPVRDVSGRTIMVINPSACADSLSDLKGQRIRLVRRRLFGGLPTHSFSLSSFLPTKLFIVGSFPLLHVHSGVARRSCTEARHFMGLLWDGLPTSC